MPDPIAARVAELNAAVEKMTPGEVIYRPYEHDDWGIVRFHEPAPMHRSCNFQHGFIYASVSTSRFTHEELCSCRENQSDPCEHDARGIAYLKNHAPALVADLMAENRRLREALAPSGETKAAYSGEFTFTLTGLDDRGNEWGNEFVVPWTTIKEIMAAIRNRAALAGKDGGE